MKESLRIWPVLAAVFLIWMPVPVFCRDYDAAGQDPDSIASFSVAYTNMIRLRRESEPFAWNDLLSEAHLNDRLSAYLYLEPFRKFTLFLKGATGFERLGGDLYQSAIVLDQGHLEYSGRAERIRIRLFSRERVFYAKSRLLRLVSNDSPFLEGRGEGIVIDARMWKRLGFWYTGAVFHDRTEVEKHGGLSLLTRTGESLNLLGAEIGWSGLRAGFSAGETRSPLQGEASLVSINLGIECGRFLLLAELAEAARGKWRDRDESRLLDLHPMKLRPDAISPVFGPSSVFSAEIHGLEMKSPSIGDLGLIPGYSYHGVDAYDPLGEIRAGIIESKLTSWWRHPELSLIFSAELIDGYRFSGDSGFTVLRALFTAGLKSGLKCSQGIIASDDRSTAYVVSFLDDNVHSRIRASILMDDARDGKKLYYLAEGIINLTQSVSLRTVLYLQGSSESFYSTGIEFSPSKRFLFRADAGSFIPFDGSLLLQGDKPDVVQKDRMIAMYARIWFGDR